MPRIFHPAVSQRGFRENPGVLLALLVTVMLASCSTISHIPKYQLGDDVYEFRQPGSRYEKVFVDVEEDTIRLFPLKGGTPVSVLPSSDEYFRQRSFDVDVMTIGFKYRPPRGELPRQLNTSFNGNLYLGYRVDRFKLDFRNTPAGIKKITLHHGFTIGVFGGLGGTAINPWTTGYAVASEYDGLILTRGVAAMFGVNNLTVGIGAGWDFLTDKNKVSWLYQNKPWLGLTVGLNLN